MKKLFTLLLATLSVAVFSQDATIVKEASELYSHEWRFQASRNKINTAITSAGSNVTVYVSADSAKAGDTISLFTTSSSEFAVITDYIFTFDYADSAFTAGSDSINVYTTSKESLTKLFEVSNNFNDTTDASYHVPLTTSSPIDKGSTTYLAIPATAFTAGNSKFKIQIFYRKEIW
jgi:hypothetical protein